METKREIAAKARRLAFDLAKGEDREGMLGFAKKAALKTGKRSSGPCLDSWICVSAQFEHLLELGVIAAMGSVGTRGETC
jgi:hypothetical protein